MGSVTQQNRRTPASSNATLNPDFSELEADAAQITGNARFAVNVLEKRPFFLESADLLETPLQFIHTRSIAAPDAGARVTRRGESVEFTGWMVRDDGGGELIIPGPFGSGTRPLDEPTDVGFGRLRLGLERFSAALDWSDRRGAAYRNSVAGADLAWQPGDSDRLSFQWLTSDTRDPSPLSESSGGLRGAGWQAAWEHLSGRFDWALRDKQIDRDFRADTGYVPAADVHESFAQLGVRLFDVGFLNELKPYVGLLRQTVLSNGELIERGIFPGFFFQGPRNLYGFVELHPDDAARAQAGAPLRSARLVRLDVTMNPWPAWPKLRVYGDVGRLLDFATDELRPGYQLTSEMRIRPTDRIELETAVSRLRLEDADSRLAALREGNESLTAIYYFSGSLNSRLQWIHERTVRAEPVQSRTSRQTATCVLTYRPGWRTQAFVGVSRTQGEDAGARDAADNGWRYFLKWTRAFGG